MQTYDDRAVRLLQLYLVLLLGIPSSLVLGPLGSAGSPASLFGVAMLAWWGIQWLYGGLQQSRLSPPVIALLVFFVISVANYSSGQLHGLTLQQATGADKGLLTLLSLIGVALASGCLTSRNSVDRVLRTFVVLCAMLSALALAQSLLGVSLSFLQIPGLSVNGTFDTAGLRSDYVRAAATTGHPIELGVLLALSLPIAIHYSIYPGGPIKSRAYHWLLVAPIVPALLLTVSRAALLGLMIGLLLLFLGWTGIRRWVMMAFAPVALVAIQYAIPGLLGTLRSYVFAGSNDPSIQGRLDDYPVVGEILSHGPVLGTGFATLIPKEFRILDNQYLGTAVEGGLLAAIGLLAVIVVGYTSARGVRLRSSGETADLGLSLGASIVVLGVSFAFFDGFGFATSTAAIPLLLGTTGALWVSVGGLTTVNRRQSPAGQPQGRTGLSPGKGYFPHN